MTLIRWTRDMQVGIPEVDRDHQQLIELINELHDAVRIGADYFQVVQALGNIYGRIAAHFAVEEDLMHESGYAAHGEHKEDHDTLLVELRDIMDTVDDDGWFDAAQLSSDLNRWFGDHFRTHDVRLHQALQRRPGTSAT